MIQQALNGMIAAMLVKFCLNDVPHAFGMLPPPAYDSIEEYRAEHRAPGAHRDVRIVPPVPTRAFGSTPKKYVPPEEEYRLVKRTKRGSRVVIRREGNQARVELANHEDATDISNLLNAAGVRFESESGISKSAWEGIPVYLRQERGPMGVEHGTYPGITITFDYGELERVMQGGILQPMMIE